MPTPALTPLTPTPPQGGDAAVGGGGDGGGGGVVRPSSSLSPLIAPYFSSCLVSLLVARTKFGPIKAQLLRATQGHGLGRAHGLGRPRWLWPR